MLLKTVVLFAVVDVNHGVKKELVVHVKDQSAHHNGGGGVVFGPTPRSYSYKLPKKVRRLAIKSVLSEKVIENKLVVVEGLSFDAPKTKEFKQVLANLSVDTKVLVVLESGNDFAALSGRNLPNVSIVESNNVSVLDVVAADKMLITKAALTHVEEVLA